MNRLGILLLAASLSVGAKKPIADKPPLSIAPVVAVDGKPAIESPVATPQPPKPMLAPVVVMQEPTKLVLESPVAATGPTKTVLDEPEVIPVALKPELTAPPVASSPLKLGIIAPELALAPSKHAVSAPDFVPHAIGNQSDVVVVQSLLSGTGLFLDRFAPATANGQLTAGGVYQVSLPVNAILTGADPLTVSLKLGVRAPVEVVLAQKAVVSPTYSARLSSDVGIAVDRVIDWFDAESTVNRYLMTSLNRKLQALRAQYAAGQWDASDDAAYADWLIELEQAMSRRSSLAGKQEP
jgi:hypothetical protein